MIGFWTILVNPFGPVQIYVLACDDIREICFPAHIGLFDAGDAMGRFNIINDVDDDDVHPLDSVTVTV